jgi:tetratricopeptide (TPR) repeat protein
MSETDTMADLDAGGQALQEGRFEEALRHGTKYLESENPQVREGAHFMVGMAYFRLHRFKDAVPYFQMIVRGGGGQLNDHFSLVTSATMSQQFDLAREEFDKFLVRVAKEGGPENGMSIPLAHYYYGMALVDAGDPDAAYEQLQTLREYYERAKNTDEESLRQKGLPPLGYCLNFAQKIISTGQPPINWKLWAQKFAEKLDENGYKTLARVAKF